MTTITASSKDLIRLLKLYAKKINEWEIDSEERKPNSTVTLYMEGSTLYKRIIFNVVVIPETNEITLGRSLLYYISNDKDTLDREGLTLPIPAFLKYFKDTKWIVIEGLEHT